jgi:DNA-binding NarL/FixJ family response regulator
MDISLRRGPNGIAVTRLLTEEQPSVRILVLSVEDGADYVRGAYEAGARGYVLKDDPSPKLLAAIHAVASGGTFWPPGVNLGTTRGALTPTQLEVARLVAAGLQSKEIADELGNSVRTVESHRAAIRERTHTSNVIEVRAWLEARGLLDDTADRCPSR